MTEAVSSLIDIEIEADGWLSVLPDALEVVERGIVAALKHMQVNEVSDIVVLLTNDAEMKALNAEFRRKNAPTNVLSFPAPDLMKGHLGDIAIGLETCVREAAEQNKSLKDHVTHLSVHATLHLLGYDHMDDQEAVEMEDLERDILKGLAIADPYDLNREA
jgi:probable rRNA maturation factor